MKIALFPGSFCPMTVGHVDIIERASKLVDKLYVVIGYNMAKKCQLSVEERVAQGKLATKHLTNVEVISHGGMMTELADELQATVMFKAVRNATELQQVVDIVDINCDYWKGETVFLVSDRKYRHISSSVVRELIALDQDVTSYLPTSICDVVVEKLRRN